MSEIREVLYRTIKGESKRAIYRSLGISRISIKKYINIAKSYGFNPLTQADQLHDIVNKIENELRNNKKYISKNEKILEPYNSAIKEYLDYKYITHQQIQRLLLLNYKTSVNIRSLNRYINKHFPSQIKSTVHLKTIPGEEAQVDYGYVGLMKGEDNLQHKTYIFVLVLSHSRYRYVEFVQSQNQKSWCKSHINAFAFFGAVPKRILLDNLKSGVIAPDIYDPTINPAYEELARFYGFIADPAKVRKPEHKGKVERSVLMAKQQLIAGFEYGNIKEANTKATNWCLNEVSERICSTTGQTPKDLFIAEDKPKMLPLPNKAFDIPVWTTGTVHKDHHVTVNGNFYSLPTDYIEKEVSMRIGLRTIEFYYQYNLVKTHTISLKKGEWVTDEKDYPESAKNHLCKQKKSCIDEASEIGESVLNLIITILKKDSKVNLRKAQAILRLSDKYGAKRLNEACLRAIKFDNYKYKSIAAILEKKLDSKGKNIDTNSDKIVDPKTSAYVRSSDEYSSNMDVNCG